MISIIKTAIICATIAYCIWTLVKAGDDKLEGITDEVDG